MLALQALCLFDALGDDFEQQLDAYLHDSHTYADIGLDSAPPTETIEFARRLALGAWRDHEQYDKLLSQTATDWSVARMPPVDRNILRLGLHELFEHPDTPPEVVIDEAIELARVFSGEDATGFINAVLDANWRQLKDSESPPAGDDQPS